MKHLHFFFLISVVVYAIIFGGTTALQAADDGFAPLFTGDSLAGWKVSDWSDLRTPQRVKGTPWKIEDGVLYGLNKRTWLISPKQYGDFVLKLDSKISKGSNGGIGLRFPPEGDPAYKGMEIQVVDDEVYYRGSSQPQQRTGSIYDEIAAGKDATRPVGQWNEWEITARGSRVTIVLNGQKIIDVDLSRETKARQKKGPPLANRPLKGHIGFQNLNGTITLRNIMLKELDGTDREFVSLFNDRNLDGWVNVNCAPETWTVRDGMIICSGIPAGVMRTDRQYENYILELEWRHMKERGNAGLFIHSDALPAPGKPFTRSIEVQILDGRNTEDYTSHGDVFAIHGATMTPDKPHPNGWMRSLPNERRCKPASQWNHYRIESRDGTVTLAVNGKIVTRGFDLNPRKGYICLESEGSLIHFRNIRICELPSSNPPAEMVAKKERVFRIGMIGLDTSHVIAFTKVINNPEKKYGCKVVVGYPGGSPDIPSSANRVEKFTNQLRDDFGLEIVDTIEELCRKVDGVLLESVDGRPHLKQVRPVIAAGKPVFIDKPMAGNLADVIEIFRLAKENNVPCWSSSSLRFSPGIIGMRENDEVGRVLGCDAFSPCSLEEHHPDLYWYGVHGVEILFTIMGTGCESVRRIQTGDCEFVAGLWKDGRVGTYRGLRTGKSGYGAMVFGAKGIAPSGGYGGYEPLVDEIIKFFKTGNAPVPPEETIEIFAFMSAADESKARGGAAVSLTELIEKAKKQNELRRSRKDLLQR